MAQSHMAKRKIEAISNGAFLICLGILFYTELWWPGILVAIWVNLAIRQYFSGRIFDLCVSSFVLLGLTFIAFSNINWTVVLPVMFVVGGIYLIFREYFFAEDTNGEEKSRELQDDADDGKDQ